MPQLDEEQSKQMEKELKRTESIIDSMTREERIDHRILNANRRRRIARGSGTNVAEVNKLIKQYTEMRQMMRQLGELRNVWRQRSERKNDAADGRHAGHGRISRNGWRRR